MLTRIYNLGVHTRLSIDLNTTPFVYIMFWSRQLERDRNQQNLANMAARNNVRSGFGRR